MHPRPSRSTLFPYTTLFRSLTLARPELAPGAARARAEHAHLLLEREQAIVHRDAGGVLLEQLERSEEHTSELQSHVNLVCRLLLEKKKNPIPTRLMTKYYIK